MSRRPRTDTPLNPETEAAYRNVLALAHRLAAGLVGEGGSIGTDGTSDAPRAAALAAAMLYFVLRISPGDMRALFLDEGSMADFAFVPQGPEAKIPALFSEAL